MPLLIIGKLENLFQLLDGDLGFVENLSERSWPQSFMVGDDDSRIWVVSTEDHVASLLPLINKPDSFESPPQLLAREIRRQLHLTRAGFELDVFEGIFFGHGIAGETAIFNV